MTANPDLNPQQLVELWQAKQRATWEALRDVLKLVMKENAWRPHEEILVLLRAKATMEEMK